MDRVHSELISWSAEEMRMRLPGEKGETEELPWAIIDVRLLCWTQGALSPGHPREENETRISSLPGSDRRVHTARKS